MNNLKKLLRIADFRRLWFGQVISDFGDGLTLLALLILTQRLTGSTVALAGVAIASTVPMILFGIPAGALADRVDRRRLMIGADLARAVVVLGFVVIRTPDLMWLLYVLAFVQASIGTLFNPAKSALVPMVVPADQLLPANTISQMSRVVANLAGTAFLGVIAAFSHYLTQAFIVDAATFAISAFWIHRISLQDTKAAAHDDSASFRKDLVAGLRAITESRILIGVLVAGAVAMLGIGAVNVLMVPLVVDVLAATEYWFGALNGMQVAGMLLSGSVVAILAQKFAPTRLVSAGLVGTGIGVSAIAIAQAPIQLGIILFVVGLAIAPVQAGVATLAQVVVADELRGRVNSALNTVISLAMVVSQAFAGVLAAAVGVRSVFVIGGVLTLAAGALSALLFAGREATPSTGSDSEPFDHQAEPQPELA